MQPYLAAYSGVLKQALTQSAEWYDSNVHMCKTIQSVLTAVARDGFCMPKNADEGEQSGTQNDATDGTGVGAGVGEKNVSKDITDESQVEGLQDGDDEQEQPDMGDAAQDDAVDMSEDFGGKMQDVEETSDADGQSGDEEEDTADAADDAVGNVDPLDPTAVDEKFWEGKDDESQEPNDAKEDTAKPVDGAADSQMAHKEEQSQSSKDKPIDSPEDPQPQPDADNDVNDMQDAEVDEQAAPDDEINTTTMPPVDQEEAPLDLPDDIDFTQPGNEDKYSDDEIDNELQADGKCIERSLHATRLTPKVCIQRLTLTPPNNQTRQIRSTMMWAKHKRAMQPILQRLTHRMRQCHRSSHRAIAARARLHRLAVQTLEPRMIRKKTLFPCRTLSMTTTSTQRSGKHRRLRTRRPMRLPQELQMTSRANSPHKLHQMHTWTAVMYNAKSNA